jgi:hypothetical protein
MDRDLGRGVDAQPDLVSPDVDDRDNDVVADHDAFVALPGEYEHGWFLPDPSWRRRSVAASHS